MRPPPVQVVGRQCRVDRASVLGSSLVIPGAALVISAAPGVYVGIVKVCTASMVRLRAAFFGVTRLRTSTSGRRSCAVGHSA